MGVSLVGLDNPCSTEQVGNFHNPLPEHSLRGLCVKQPTYKLVSLVIHLYVLVVQSNNADFELRRVDARLGLDVRFLIT